MTRFIIVVPIILLAIFAFITLLVISPDLLVYDVIGFSRDKWFDSEVTPIISSAQFVAAQRAVESSRKGSLFYGMDPFAAHFAGREWVDLVAGDIASHYNSPLFQPLRENHINPVALRTLAISDRIATAVTGAVTLTRTSSDCLSCVTKTAQRVNQVVVFGAGMDTKPYSFGETNTNVSNSSVSWFEVDIPSVIELKKELAKSIPVPVQLRALNYIPVDLNNEIQQLLPRLILHGFNVSAPTIYVFDGSIMNVKIPVVRSLFSSVLPNTEGSRVVVTSVTYSLRRALLLMRWINLINSTIKSTLRRFGIINNDWMHCNYRLPGAILGNEQGKCKNEFDQACNVCESSLFSSKLHRLELAKYWRNDLLSLLISDSFDARTGLMYWVGLFRGVSYNKWVIAKQCELFKESELERGLLPPQLQEHLMFSKQGTGPILIDLIAAK